LAGAQYVWLIPRPCRDRRDLDSRRALALVVGDQRDHLPRSRYFNATAIGYLVTNIFPLRLGELAAFSSSPATRNRRSGLAASTVVVEHVLDVLVVLGILIVIVMTGSLPVPDWGAARRSSSPACCSAARSSSCCSWSGSAAWFCGWRSVISRIPRLIRRSGRRSRHMLDVSPCYSRPAAGDGPVLVDRRLLCSAMTFYLSLKPLCRRALYLCFVHHRRDDFCAVAAGYAGLHWDPAVGHTEIAAVLACPRCLV